MGLLVWSLQNALDSSSTSGNTESAASAPLSDTEAPVSQDNANGTGSALTTPDWDADTVWSDGGMRL